MKDIDFDELDKAVSSLLGEAEKETVHNDDPSISPDVPDSHENLNANDQGHYGNDELTPEPQAPAPVEAAGADNDTSSSSSQPNLVEKRSKGRFMDVVHPSSDMRNLQKPSIPRTAPDVLPVESTIVDEVSDVSPVLASDTAKGEFESSTNTESPRDESLAEAALDSDDELHNQPDPLDFHGFLDDEAISEDKESEAPSSSTSDENESLASTEIETKNETDHVATDPTETELTVSSLDQQPPLETPFVSTVDSFEKRPLGAFSGNGDVEANPDEQESELSDNSSIEAKQDEEEKPSVEQADPGNEEPQRNEEADSTATSSTNETELYSAASEAATSDDQSTRLDESVNKEAELQTVPEPDTTPEELREELVSIEAAEVTAANPVGVLSSAGSIPQQYTTKAASQHTESTAVFDTDQYHQPLKHTPKKKSGVGIVIFIVVLIIVGIGGGVAFYFFDPLHLFS